jgi:hypothetical protein
MPIRFILGGNTVTDFDLTLDIMPLILPIAIVPLSYERYTDFA